MVQKVIQVGNSLAITIPKGWVKEMGLKAGATVMVEYSTAKKAFSVSLPQEESVASSPLTPEFVEWLEKFNVKYKTVLTELAKK